MGKKDLVVDRDILSPDKYNLDEEWTNQPRLYFEYAEKLADAKRDLDETKANADLVKAEVALDIREDPEEYDLEKVTEAAIQNALTQSAKVQKANQAVITAKHKVDILQAAVIALDHRKRALQDLVNLHTQNYFSTPRLDGDGEDPAERVVANRAKKKLNRKKAKR